MKGLDEWITRDDREPIIPNRWAIEGHEDAGTFETKVEALKYLIDIESTYFYIDEYPEDYIYEFEGVK